MNEEERKVKKKLDPSVSKPLKFASDESHKQEEVKNANVPEIKSVQESAKEQGMDDEEDLNASGSTSEDEKSEAKLDSETYINSDEYMSNISEEECAVFMCNECGKTFNNGVSLKAHLAKKHNPRALINCELCETKYRGKFIEHLDSDHSSIDGGYYCKKCDFICPDYETILKHRHDKDALNICKHCGKMYKSKENYKLHLLIHSNGGCKRKKEKFSCETCGKNFLFTCFVKDELNISTEMKPYYSWKCQICRCSSTKNSTSKQVSAVRNSERPYKCSECSRAFFRNGDLKKHMRSHAGGERPFM